MIWNPWKRNRILKLNNQKLEIMLKKAVEESEHWFRLYTGISKEYNELRHQVNMSKEMELRAIEPLPIQDDTNKRVLEEYEKHMGKN